jgi:hypothetical protein
MSDDPTDPLGKFKSGFDLMVHAARQKQTSTQGLCLLLAKVKATGENVGLIVAVRSDGNNVAMYPIGRMLKPGEAEELYELPGTLDEADARGPLQ